MPEAHIAVTSFVPSEPLKLDPSSALGADALAGDNAFAALLGERLDALAPTADDAPPADALAASPTPDDEGHAASEAPADAALAMLASLPTLSTAPALPEGEASRAVAHDAAQPADAAAGNPIPAWTLPDVAQARASVEAEAAPRTSHVLQALSSAAAAQNPIRLEAHAPAQSPEHAVAPTAELAATPMLASPQSTLAAAPLAAPAAPAVAVATPMQAPEWRDAVAERVTLLVRDRVHAAELHVNPPELGPVSVRIDVSGSDAAVVFGAQHAETRNLLTEALPRLAEALAAGGITLSGAQVGAEFQPQRDRSDDAPRGGNGEQKASDAQPTKVIARGLIDVFA